LISQSSRSVESQ